MDSFEYMTLSMISCLLSNSFQKNHLPKFKYFLINFGKKSLPEVGFEPTITWTWTKRLRPLGHPGNVTILLSKQTSHSVSIMLAMTSWIVTFYNFEPIHLFLSLYWRLNNIFRPNISLMCFVFLTTQAGLFSHYNSDFQLSHKRKHLNPSI